MDQRLIIRHGGFRGKMPSCNPLGQLLEILFRFPSDMVPQLPDRLDHGLELHLHRHVPYKRDVAGRGKIAYSTLPWS